MARFVSNSKPISVFIASEFSVVLTRRGFATTTQGVAAWDAAINGSATVMLKKGSEESGKTSWVPDPVTGYYRPENQTKEFDLPELREMLINNKIRGN